MVSLFFVCLFVFIIIIFLLENKCKFAAYNWLQISCINTFLLKNSGLLLRFIKCIVQLHYNPLTYNEC